MARLSATPFILLSWSVLTAALPTDSLLSPASNSASTRSFNVLEGVPPLNYQPDKSGILYTIKNESAKPWLHVSKPHSHTVNHVKSCPSLSPSNPSQWWYEAVAHNGESSYMDSSYKDNYAIFRNVVTDFGADNTGAADASAAIQNAINAGASNGPARNSNSMGTTGQPAVVYIPSGTYLMEGSLQLFVGTVLVGDPINPPVLKASANFPNDHIIYGKDPNQGGTVNFYIALKNVIIDSTNVDKDQTLGLLDWTVSQATQLTNVVFNMPDYSTGHTGVTSQYGYNSATIMNDLTFYGGVYAMQLSGQQWTLKNININGATTGISAGGFNLVIVDSQFQNVATGIDASGISGSLTVIDSSGSSLGTLISGSSSGSAGNTIVLDNVQNSGNTVTLGGNVVLSGSVSQTWVYGDLYAKGSLNSQHEAGQTVTTPRPSSLVSNGKYFTMPPPTFQQYSADQVINIKSVSGLPVYGDGVTDDTVNINAILSQYAGCNVIYFPAGTYIVTSTILIPAGSRIYGDAYASAISALGSNYYNPNAPSTMVQVGNSGDVGVAQIVDMLFTVADVLQGCKLVEVNIAGSSPGDVGFWNTHFRIGGAAGSKVETNCGGSPDECKAAWGMLHLTSSSSVYIENMWGWTADHALDGGNAQTISTGRGMLVEATKGTWLIGTAYEHNTLYQYNFNSAQNVFSAFQQSETPYWQGPGNDLAPAPWADNLIASDPSFSNCDSDDALCRMAFFEHIQNSSNLFLYGGCIWTFFNNNGNCNDGDCQQNAIQISSSSSLYLYGTNSKAVTNVFIEQSTDVATESANSGGWGAVIAAYLFDS